MGWAFNGALPMANDGAILITFAGRPAPIPAERWPSDPKSAGQILRVFARYWPDMQESETLQGEIAQRAIALVSHACPAAAIGSGAGLLEWATERVAQEWDRTLARLGGWLGGADDRGCWQGDDQKTLDQLRKVTIKIGFTGSGGLLGAVGSLLGGGGGSDGLSTVFDGYIAADGATPIFGQGVLAAGGWALIWTGFLVVFRYSARVRGIYLYNEKMRGWLSLWFPPAIMTLLPFLRRRMLRPFRDELLADAHLATLAEAEFYPGLRVRNR